MSSRANPKVYMDIQISSKGAGRIIFQLFTDFTPKTAQNFRGLCTGEYDRVGNVKLSYMNSKFHRIIDGFVIQGGDITHGNGTGGFSIYGRSFNDETFTRKHSCAGLLSMANCGRNTNSSQFFITLKPCPHLDDKHIVFGQVIDGMEVVKQISKVPIDKNDKPRIPVLIVDCGQIGDFKGFMKYDPFKKSVFQKIRAKREEIIKDQHLMRKLLSEGLDPNEAYEYKRKLQKCDKDLNQLLKQEKLLELDVEKEANEEGQQQQEEEQAIPEQFELTDDIKKKLGDKNLNKFLDIRLKINEANVQNSKAALEEEIRENDVNYKKMLKNREWLERIEQQEKELQARGIKKNKLYMNRNALKREKEEKDDQSFGWNVFGQEAQYKAYERRVEKLQFDQGGYQKQMEEPNQPKKPSEDALNNLVSELKKQEQKRQQFSRRRMYDEDEKVTYINERNRVFNKKLDRSFGKYTSKIETAMEMNNQK